ncbi:MAG: malectin, partial [Deltaproteobacteria bacterium]|nr:malectin [Deltaproteobacteria bacterium]
VDAQGIIYQADTKFSGGQTYTTASAIDGTTDDVLYQSERFGDFSYNISLPNGSYKVVLKFAEIYAHLYGSDSRVFDVKIEGQTVIKNLDLFAKVGGKYKAYDVTLPVNLTDGVLNMEFKSVVGGAKVSAILVQRLASFP